MDATIKVVRDQAVLPGHLPALTERIRPAVEVAEKAASGSLLANACAENVRFQVALLKQASPIISKSDADKKIEIVGVLYNLPTGEVTPVKAGDRRRPKRDAEGRGAYRAAVAAMGSGRAWRYLPKGTRAPHGLPIGGCSAAPRPVAC